MKRAVILCAFLLVGIAAAVGPPSRETEAQANCFPETGFCVTNPLFMEYFRVRGGVRIMGYPISRSFTLEGFEVQFFQRVIMQRQGNTVQRLNVLDPNVMPMTRANQSIFPGPDPALAAQAPQVGAPDYPRQVVEFVRQVAPDSWGGQPVGFFNLFNTTVPVDVAFPGQTPNPDLVTLLNLEIWGLPTSNPAADPGNGGFIYQRFQRGIMHFRAEVPVTEGILVGEYLKAVMTYRALPPDLAEDMRDSRYRAQYSPGSQGWLTRPAELPSTDLTGAFEPGSGPVGQPTPPPTVPPAATPTPTATATPTGPSVTIQVDDETIDPGQSISVTIIAQGSSNLYLLQWRTVYGDDDPDGDGANNRAEFMAGTDPTNEGSVFQVLMLTLAANWSSPTPRATITVFWSAVPGRSYRIQAKESADAGWTNIPGEVLAFTPSASKTFSIAFPPSQGFFRAVSDP